MLTLCLCNQLTTDQPIKSILTFIFFSGGGPGEAEKDRRAVHQQGLVQGPQVALVQLLRQPRKVLAQDVLPVEVRRVRLMDIACISWNFKSPILLLDAYSFVRFLNRTTKT